MRQPTHNPQRGPALALLQLLTEHPELPQTYWQIHRGDPVLRGQVHSPDARPATAAWAEFLGVEPAKRRTYLYAGELHSSQRILATWRDIEIELCFYSSAVAYPNALSEAAA